MYLYILSFAVSQNAKGPRFILEYEDKKIYFTLEQSDFAQAFSQLLKNEQPLTLGANYFFPMGN